MFYDQEFFLPKLKHYTALLAGLLGLGCLAALSATPLWAQSNPAPLWAQNNASADKPVQVAQSESAIRRRVNTGIVTVMTGGIGGVSNTYSQLASDMASVLDLGSDLRILPIVGYGSLKNIEDLLYLRGIDFSMVHSDVMRHMEQNNIMPSAKRKLRYVTKLYDESLHILANTRYSDVGQLNGKTVIVGRPGTGNEMSALTLIADLRLDANIVHLDLSTGFSDALERVRRGEAAAIVMATRKPSSRLRKIDTGSELHFLPVPMTRTILRTYEAEPLTSQDYPNLIRQGTEIVTAQMSVVLAVYNWQPRGSRFANVNHFIESFSDHLDLLTEAKRSDIWGKIDVVSDVKGWERFQPAVKLVQDVIAARTQETTGTAAVEDGNSEFAQFARYIRSTTEKELSDEALKNLFDKYKAWGSRTAQQ